MIKWGLFTKKRSLIIIGIMAIICIAAIAIGLYFHLARTEEEVYTHAAITTNGYPCADIGRDILKRKGSAVEAAIAALFCDGVVCLQSMGLGGGFLMTIYEKNNNKVITLNAREKAPKNANETMFNGNKTLAEKGGLAVAVPGELKGYWEAYNRYKSGNVEWADLIQPTIDLCRKGITVTAYFARFLKLKEEDIKNSPTLSEILIDKKTNSVWKKGDVFKRLKLADTLEIIKMEKADALYNGSLTDNFINDIKELGGIITKEDLAEYSPEWTAPVVTQLKDNITLYTAPLPGSGILLTFMLNILDGFIPTKNTITNFQRIIETFKYGYGQRTHFGDPKFVDSKTISELIQQLTSKSYAESVRQKISDNRTSQDPAYYGAEVVMPEDHGTAHITVLAPNGDAVSVTSTINLLFGAMVGSKSTGIILNDEMDDFSAPNITNGFGVPPSPNNFIKPGKRPLSSMVPSIFIDMKGDVRLIVGGAGGTKITSSTALVAAKVLWFNMTIKEAIEEPRMHHQLFPMHIQYEKGTPENIIEGLKKIGHQVEELNPFPSYVSGIVKKDGKIYAHSESRRHGVAAGF